MGLDEGRRSRLCLRGVDSVRDKVRGGNIEIFHEVFDHAWARGASHRKSADLLVKLHRMQDEVRHWWNASVMVLEGFGRFSMCVTGTLRQAVPASKLIISQRER